MGLMFPMVRGDETWLSARTNDFFHAEGKINSQIEVLKMFSRQPLITQPGVRPEKVLQILSPVELPTPCWLTLAWVASLPSPSSSFLCTSWFTHWGLLFPVTLLKTLSYGITLCRYSNTIVAKRNIRVSMLKSSYPKFCLVFFLLVSLLVAARIAQSNCIFTEICR